MASPAREPAGLGARSVRRDIPCGPPSNAQATVSTEEPVQLARSVYALPVLGEVLSLDELTAACQNPCRFAATPLARGGVARFRRRPARSHHALGGGVNKHPLTASVPGSALI